MPQAAKKAAVETGLIAGNKVIKTYGSIKIEESQRVVKFDDDAIPEPPKFATWNGAEASQPGLSSKPEINAANDAIVQSLYAAAKKNDLTALQKIDPGPSQHTKAYKANLNNLLGQVGTVVTKTKFVGNEGGKVDAGQMAKDIGSAFPSKQNWDATADKFHKFVIAGETDKSMAKAMFDAIPQVKISGNDKLSAELLDKAHMAPAAAKFGHEEPRHRQLVTRSTRSFATASREHRSTPPRSSGRRTSKAGSTNCPTGLTLSRKVNIGSSKDWESMVGKIITEPGINSTSFSPGVWSGNVWLKLKTGAGVKGAYIANASKSKNGALSGIPSEKEVILPRNTKWYVANVKKGGDDSFFTNANSKQTIVEIVVLPNDPPK